MMRNLDPWKRWYQEHRDEILEDFFQFLRFKSIGTDSKYHADTKACASWLENYLKEIGLSVEQLPSSGMPVVLASDLRAGKDRPTLMLYHHYDVQPVDPLNLWDSDPFDPQIRDGNVFARGAEDNKGQCFYSITAIKAFYELAKERHFNLKVFIEGEEESGSTGTYEVLKKDKEKLKSDYLLVVDSGIPEKGQGAISLGTRGLVTMEVMLRTAKGDMHSGSMGGVAPNPIHVLIQAFSKCWDEKGKIKIPHFYDDVMELSDSAKKTLDIELNEKRIQKEFGLNKLAPEPGFTIGESHSIRPTFEINGMSGGYTGEGFKTVLPAVASAKVSCRLVPNQDPEKVFNSVKNYLESVISKEYELIIKPDHGAKAFRANENSLIAKVVSKAYEEVLETPCKKVLMGGSIPIVLELAKSCQAEALLMGYGLDTDQIHAPNEHFGLDRFEQGFLTIGSILSQFNEK